MLAGKLNQVVAIQTQTQSKSATGAIKTAWILQGQVWANVQFLSAKDLVLAKSTQSQIVGKVVMRKRKLTSDMRVVIGGKTYLIDGEPITDEYGFTRFMIKNA